jgi:hypothetical protein
MYEEHIETLENRISNLKANLDVVREQERKRICNEAARYIQALEGAGVSKEVVSALTNLHSFIVGDLNDERAATKTTH